MSTASLLKRAPILIMVVCLSYACYTIHAILPDAGSGPGDLAKGLEIMVEDALHTCPSRGQLAVRFWGWMLREATRAAVPFGPCYRPT